MKFISTKQHYTENQISKIINILEQKIKKQNEVLIPIQKKVLLTILHVSISKTVSRH